MRDRPFPGARQGLTWRGRRKYWTVASQPWCVPPKTIKACLGSLWKPVCLARSAAVGRSRILAPPLKQRSVLSSPTLFVVFRPAAVMADIKKPISITDKVLKEGSGDVNKLVGALRTSVLL